MNKYTSLVFLILVHYKVAYADLSAAAGQTLLESFRCESTNGSATQGVRTSLTSLKSTLEKIAEQQKDCQADVAAVGQLPEIDSILRQIDNYGFGEDAKRQEALIAEALNDLAIVKNMPPDSPDRNLYPTEAVLQSMIADARVELIHLRASLNIEASKANRQKYLDGVRQLDTLAQELAGSLRKNSPCFQKNPTLRRQVLVGLAGIAGFFAKTPLGIGITLASRVLQNIFDIGDADSVNENKNFESSHQTLLAAGLSCTLENLAAQHCRLIRRDALLQQMKSKPCKDKRSTECTPEMQKLLSITEKGKSATDAIDEVTAWLGGKTDNTSDQAMAGKISADFTSITSTFETGVNTAQEKAKRADGSSLADVQSERQAKQLTDLIAIYSYKLYGDTAKPNGDRNSRRGGIGMGASDGIDTSELNAMFTQDEKERGPLNFIYDDKEYAAILGETAQRINASPRLKQVFGVENTSGTTGRTSAEQAAKQALQDAFTGQRIEDLPEADKVKERLKSRVAFDRIKSKVAQYKSQILERTTVKPPDEQLGNFIMAFTQEDVGKPSTLKHIDNIKSFFEAIPEDFVKTRDPILNISGLKKEIAEISVLGGGLDNGIIPMTKENVSELYVKMTRLLDPARGFKARLTNIATNVGSFQTQKMSRLAKQPQDLNDLVFLQNKDFLESVYDLKNPYQKEMDTKTAIALSASQIDSFGKFFDSYSDPALKMLNKSDIKGKKFSDGLSENIDRTLKDHFCIQALGLTSIPKKIVNECQGAVLKMGSSELRFIDFDRAPHKERVCAYRNFINRIDYNQTKKDTEQQKSIKGVE